MHEKKVIAKTREFFTLEEIEMISELPLKVETWRKDVSNNPSALQPLLARGRTEGSILAKLQD